ncbi:hypothetical protein HQ535_01005 [bacterium]|nr:hypothetical protein [bacterium]
MLSIVTMRAAVQAGLDAGAVAAGFGGTIRQVISGEERTPGPGWGAEPDVDAGLLRVAGYLQSAIAAALAGNDPGDSLELAMRAADRSGGEHGDVHAAIAATLEAAASSPRGRISLMLCATSAALTPDVAVPSL